MREETVARDGINKRGIQKFRRDLQKEFDRQGPIQVPVETNMPTLPPRGAGTTVNYHGPVFQGDITGGQIAWGNDSVTQNQQVGTSEVAPAYTELAKFLTELLQQLSSIGLGNLERQDAEAAATDVLTEITQPEPEPGKLRRALATLRGYLAPIAAGLVAGTAEGAQAWAKAAIAGLTGVA